MRILGIDPGSRRTGWGVVEQHENRLRHVGNGVIKPDPSAPDAIRLDHIATELAAVIANHAPDVASIEEIFVAKSAASALKLGMARGVAIMQCGAAGLEVTEIAARYVKKAVTGSGAADKKQVTAMVERLLGVTPKNADAADALAIAIAAGHQAPIDIAAATNRTGVAPAARVGSTGKDTPQPGLSAAIERALARDAEKDNK